MKKLVCAVVLAVVFLLVLPLSSCAGSNVTPVALVGYKAQGDEFAYYDSVMVADHVYVFESADDFPVAADYDQPADFRLACFDASFLRIRYKRILGSENVDGQTFHYVDVADWYMVEVAVEKDSPLYSPQKSVYLNGKKLAATGKHDSVYESDLLVIFHFEDCGLARSNVGGTIHTDVVNLIEYK